MFKKYLPKKESITSQHASWLGKRIHDHNLWCYNLQSVRRGVAIGLFVAFIPLPMQMILAILLATLLGGNIPLAIACTWITNPLTFIPINYFIYDLGALILNLHHQDITIKPLVFHNELAGHLDVLLNWINALGKPFLIGLPIVAFSVVIISYIVLSIGWLIIDKIKHIFINKIGK